MKGHLKAEVNIKITSSYNWVSVINKAYDESINKAQHCCAWCYKEMRPALSDNNYKKMEGEKQYTIQSFWKMRGEDKNNKKI